MVQRHPGFGLAERIAVEEFTRKLGTQVMAQIGMDPFGAEQIVGVAPLNLAESVVDGRFQGTGRHELGQPWNRLGQRHLRGDFRGAALVQPGQLAGDRERVADQGETPGVVHQRIGQRGHRRQGLLDRDRIRRPGPDVAQWGRAPAASAAAGASFHLGRDLQDHGASDDAAAKFDRRAIGHRRCRRFDRQQAAYRWACSRVLVSPGTTVGSRCRPPGRQDERTPTRSRQFSGGRTAWECDRPTARPDSPPGAGTWSPHSRCAAGRARLRSNWPERQTSPLRTAQTAA